MDAPSQYKFVFLISSTTLEQGSLEGEQPSGVNILVPVESTSIQDYQTEEKLCSIDQNTEIHLWSLAGAQGSSFLTTQVSGD
jgi:hypothetical protein